MKISVNGTPRLALALAMLTSMAFAMVQSTDATQGTIVNVQKSTVATPEITGAGDGTDNPLQEQHYSYDISVKVGHGLYVGRYESELNYLSNSLAPNHVVPVRLERGVMYLDSQGDSLATTIVSRKGDSRENSNQTASIKADAKM
jgi:hypothetical protein